MDYSLIEQDLEGTPDGEVYFIFMECDDKKCKIGKSDNPKKRTLQLQTGNPYELYVYKTLPGYARLEKMLHNYFKEKKIKREWFNITFEDVDDIVEQYKEAKEEYAQISESEEYNELEENIDEKDNILGEKTIELIEETNVIKKKVYKMKKEEKPFICTKCNKRFEDKTHLKRHLQKQIPCDKIFKWTKCLKIFSNQSTLLRHTQRKTDCVILEPQAININNSNYTCFMCSNTYSSLLSLKRHEKNCAIKDDPHMLMIRLLESEQKRLNAERAQFNIEKQIFELQKNNMISSPKL